MGCIKLIQSIKLFGKKDGFGFWFSWNVKFPIEQWIWLNITHKPYCLHCGWYCQKDCKEKKLYSKQDILNHFEENEREIETVETGDNGMCIYCGEEEGEIKIPNPDWGKLSQWLVCRTCEEVIKYQQQMSIGERLGSEKMVNEANAKLGEIAKRTGKPILNACIFKKEDGSYDYTTIEFTGKKGGE